MPNSAGYLDPDDWRILDLALQDLDDVIAAFAAARAQQGRDVLRKSEVLAEAVADDELAPAFARVAEAGWARVRTWTRDDLEPAFASPPPAAAPRWGSRR